MIVTCEFDSNIAILTLNDQKKRNTLTKDLILSLNKRLDELEENKTVKVVILTGYENVFSAGANLKELQDYKKNKDTQDFIEDWQRLSHFTKPVIIALNGITYGGGLELALMGDIIIASDDAQIALPELSVGVIPGGGATQRLTHLIGQKKTSYLCMTGLPISAQKAFEWGIIEIITQKENLLSESIKLAKDISKKPLSLLRQVKKSIQFAFNQSLKEGLKTERNLFFETLHFEGHDAAIQAFFERKKD
jgi:enoyl-CoA hydratase/carnithine racemase